MRIPETPPQLSDLLAEERPPERMMQLFSLVRQARTQRHYLHWDKLRRYTPPPGVSHREWWMVQKLSRTDALKPIPLHDKIQRPFQFAVPELVMEELHEIDLGAGGLVSIPEPITNPQTRDRYLVSSLMEEAITSSQLEGAVTTREVAKEMIRSGRKPRDTSEQMILNNYATMQRIRALKESPLTPEMVFQIHRLVTEKTLDDPTAAGRLRRADEKRVVGDDYGQIYHDPPPAEELEARMAAMCAFANAETPDFFIHPAVRAIILHFWLAYDHPFVDGNGRTARALFYWAMLHSGYWLFEFISISSILRKAPGKYGRSFLYTETDDNDLTYFLIAQSQVIRSAIRELHTYIERKTAEMREVESHMRALDLFNHRQAEIIRHALKHPKHIAAVKKVEALRESLNRNLSKAGEILDRQYTSSMQTEAKLNEALKGQESTALDLNNLAIPFNVLQREVESDRALYESVIKRMNETSVTSGIEQAPFTLIEEPMVASKPAKPKKLRTLALVLVLSSMAAVGGLVVYDNLDTSLRSIDDAESVLELSSLAGIPDHRPAGFAKFRQVVSREREVLPDRIDKARKLAAKRRGGGAIGAADLQDLVKPAPTDRSNKERYPIATIDDPSSALAEAYRTLRANLSMLGPEDTRRILLFVSAIPEEGKTYTSLNTAVVLAQQGHKTLLIDIDLRRPSMHKAVLPSDELCAGLTDVFTGNAKLDDVIRPTGIDNLFFLSAGNRAPNPAELLASVDVAALVSTLGDKFERVIFDSAPVNAVSDTLSVAPHVHKTVLVVRAGKTPRKAVNRALMLLRKSGAKVAGFVLNRLPTGRTAGYYYYYYGDKYEKDSAYGGKKAAA